ncbi:MAG: hypothetical protein Q9204_004647 [Flavoplaca sp. TL-2023a]
MYAGLGLSAVIFVIHGILLHGWASQNQRMSLDWMALMATFNLLGATIYAARILPRRCFPVSSLAEQKKPDSKPWQAIRFGVHSSCRVPEPSESKFSKRFCPQRASAAITPLRPRSGEVQTRRIMLHALGSTQNGRDFMLRFLLQVHHRALLGQLHDSTKARQISSKTNVI